MQKYSIIYTGGDWILDKRKLTLEQVLKEFSDCIAEDVDRLRENLEKGHPVSAGHVMVVPAIEIPWTVSVELREPPRSYGDRLELQCLQDRAS